jgi:hypothetical protein
MRSKSCNLTSPFHAILPPGEFRRVTADSRRPGNKLREERCARTSLFRTAPDVRDPERDDWDFNRVIARRLKPGPIISGLRNRKLHRFFDAPSFLTQFWFDVDSSCTFCLLIWIFQHLGGPATENHVRQNAEFLLLQSCMTNCYILRSAIPSIHRMLFGVKPASSTLSREGPR